MCIVQDILKESIPSNMLEHRRKELKDIIDGMVDLELKYVEAEIGKDVS